MKVAELCLISACLLASQRIFVHSGSADPDDFRKLTAGARKKCLKELQIPAQLVVDTEYGEFPEDEKLKCYFKCALEKFNMMDAGGDIKYNALKKFVPEPYKEIGVEMIDSCTGATGKDNCDKAFNFMKCMFEVNPLAFIAP